MSSYNKILVLLTTLVFGIFILNTSFSQEFAPQVGFHGSSAVHKDSSVFVSWANSCFVIRGYIDITDTTKTFQGSNKATFGADSMALGKPEGNMNIVSLGDGGSAILTFNPPICNKTGFDFAVFENGFIAQNEPKMAFLELAFVEVSSNGQDFFRFPATSTTSNEFQVSTFDNLDATNIHNLAGKYPSDYGTPFDLKDLQEFAPELDLNHVTQVKIIDVIGTTNEEFASYDNYGNIINDPFPTPFNSCGFDLNGIGVIHQAIKFNTNNKISVYPNPTTNYVNISSAEIIEKIIISNIQGQQIMVIENNNNFAQIDISQLKKGVYIIYSISKESIYSEKLLIK